MLMKRILYCLINVAVMLAGCHPVEDFGEGNQADFDALWTLLDEHYCFFDEKDVDWEQVRADYQPRITAALSQRQLFGILADMVNELKDGHTNLSAAFETSYYRKWWSDYPENFSGRLVEEYYFHFDYKQVGGVTYGILPQNVGYIRIPSFSSSLGSGNISWILSDMMMCNALIIDVRNNGGGDMSQAEEWVRHFITDTITAGYISHKTGPGHGEFSSPRPIVYKPLPQDNVVWVKPVAVLTNRHTFSAANHFTAVMSSLPHVVHTGATTGGGSGMPISYELPGGWSVRMSAVSVTDPQGRVTEHGIEPQYPLELSAEEALLGRDTMLDGTVGIVSGGIR